MKPSPTLAEEYRAMRTSLGTQAEVAKILGVDPQTISRRERGEIRITDEAVLALQSLRPNRDLQPRRKNPNRKPNAAGPANL